LWREGEFLICEMQELCVVNTGSDNDQTVEIAVGSAISEQYAIGRSLRPVASRRSHSEFSHIYLMLPINRIDVAVDCS